MSAAPDLTDQLAPATTAELAAIFPPGRQPTKPCLIPPLGEDPLSFPTVAHLAQAVAERLGDRRLVLVRGVATYPGFDTFPIFSVHAENVRGLSAGPSSATYLCAVAVQDTPAEDLDAAIVGAQRRAAA